MNKKEALIIFSIVVLALGLRLVIFHYSWSAAPLHDECDYVDKAKQIVQRGDFNGAFRPPLYPYFLAGLIKIFGYNLFLMRLTQVIIGALTVVLVYVACKVYFNEKVAYVAALIYSIDPKISWYSCFFWPETLFVFFFIPCIYLLIRPDTNDIKKRFLVAGFLFGVSALTKGVILYFIVFVLLWILIYKKEEKYRLCVLFLIGALVVISPWTFRNYCVLKAFVPIDTNGAFNLYRGNNETWDYGTSPVEQWRNISLRYDSFGKNEVEKNKVATKETIKYIYNEQPQWIFKKIYYEFPRTWSPALLPLIHIKFGRYGKLSPVTTDVIVIGFIVSFYLLLFSSIFGFIYAGKKGPDFPLVLALMIYLIFAFIVTFGYTRFNFALLPFLMFYSAFAVINYKAILMHGIKSRRNLVGILFCLLFFYWWTISFNYDYTVSMINFVIVKSFPASFIIS